MIVATAGHIDHGKTRLIRHLTGVDTDRLPEERARGISIDLGFAHANLGNARPVSFIDVPGHQRFVRNMLAGVGAIDACLLVVAADDGVMPQTLEHLSILDLLDVRRGALVITKTDLVTAERVAEVKLALDRVVADTSLAGADAFPVSLATGIGLDGLRQWLADEAECQTAPGEDGKHFRLAIDRAFTILGSGTVVTGTVRSGGVALGDHLIISPSGLEVRVRGVQVQSAHAAGAFAGQRCALNLGGVSVAEVGRGDWILDPALHAPTSRIDARLRVASGEEKPFEHWTPVHLHVGTAVVIARIAIFAEDHIPPGGAGYVQIVPERPISILHGDRFVVRDNSARRTIGGGIALDPFASRRARFSGLRLAQLQAAERDSPGGALQGLLDLAVSGVDLDAFARAYNLSAERASALQREHRTVLLGKKRPVGVSHAAAELLRTRVLDVLGQFHAAQPRAVGMTIAALRKAVGSRLAPVAFQHFVRELANRQSLILSNDAARLNEHDPTANAADAELWLRIRSHLETAGVHAPLLVDLAKALNEKTHDVRDLLHRKSRTGGVLRVTDERFCLRETLAQLAATSVAVACGSETGCFSAAQFRDAIGTGRGLAIHYLELFDRLGLTLRQGNKRRIGKDFVSTLGDAEPVPLARLL